MNELIHESESSQGGEPNDTSSSGRSTASSHDNDRQHIQAQESVNSRSGEDSTRRRRASASFDWSSITPVSNDLVQPRDFGLTEFSDQYNTESLQRQGFPSSRSNILTSAMSATVPALPSMPDSQILSGEQQQQQQVLLSIILSYLLQDPSQYLTSFRPATLASHESNIVTALVLTIIDMINTHLPQQESSLTPQHRGDQRQRAELAGTGSDAMRYPTQPPANNPLQEDSLLPNLALSLTGNPPPAPPPPYPQSVSLAQPPTAQAMRQSQMQPSIDDTALSSFTMATSGDAVRLSKFQALLRCQLEYFTAGPDDVQSTVKGRRKSISLGQIGIRCKHCRTLPLRGREKGAIYYPTKLDGVYQAAQNMAASHVMEACQSIDPAIKTELHRLKQIKQTPIGGKRYWAEACQNAGIYEAEDGLRLGTS